MRDHIKERYYEIQKKNKEFMIFKSIPFQVLNPFADHINTKNIIDHVERYLTPEFVRNIETIYVSDSRDFQIRNIDALYQDGSIYVFNHKDDPSVPEERIAKDIIHEIGHSLESTESLTIYGDQALEEEFLAKRRTLFEMLDLEEYEIPEDLVFDPEFHQEMDEFLHDEVGYDQLSVYIIGLFTSPYSVTSLSEYFSNGFEDYFTGDRTYLEDMCPTLFRKIEELERELTEL